LAKCLVKDPKNRPSAKDLLAVRIPAFFLSFLGAFSYFFQQQQQQNISIPL